MGGADSCWDHCGVDGSTEEGNSGTIAATDLKDIGLSNKVSRHIKI
jgi:hypothetical protein